MFAPPNTKGGCPCLPPANDSTPIEIDLTRDFTPETISSAQLIHYRSVHKLENLVKDALPHKGGNQSNNRVFFIDGTRGAGKSTFLNAIAKHLGEANLGLRQLPTIDPTLLETGEQNILFSILFHLKIVVEKAHALK